MKRNMPNKTILDNNKKKKRVPRSIKIDGNLWREFKILAIRERTTASKLLIQLIRELAAAKKKKAKREQEKPGEK